MRNAASHLKRADPVLRPLVERVGPCRIPQRRPDFSTLARAIVFQQLNGRAAQTIFDRLVAALPGGRLTPQAVLGLPQRKLRAAGLSAQKAAYLRDLAAQTAAGAIRFPRLAALPDDQVVAALTQVKGVGVWTAQMFLIFALRRPDVLAVGITGCAPRRRSCTVWSACPRRANSRSSPNRGARFAARPAGIFGGART